MQRWFPLCVNPVSMTFPTETLKYAQLQKWARKPAVRHFPEQIPEPEISVQVPVQLLENSTAVSAGDFQMAAVVIVNAIGDIFNPKNGQKIAGLKTPDRKDFLDSVQELYRFMTPHDQFTGNTTIGAVITNGAFSKAELNKIASMTRCAYARCINPVATMADGDSIYAASIGDVSVDINMAGTLAAEVMAQAIQNAIHTSQIPDEEFLKYV